MSVEVVHNQMDGVGSGIGGCQTPYCFGELVAGTVRSGPGEVASRKRFDGTKHVGGATAFVTRSRVWPAVPAGQRCPDACPDAELRAFRPGKRRVPWDRGAFRREPEHPPSARYRRHQARARTTFFSRHGLRSWSWSAMRMTSRPTPGMSFLFFTSAASSRIVQRAYPAGAGLQANAITLCFCATSRAGFFPGRSPS